MLSETGGPGSILVSTWEAFTILLPPPSHLKSVTVVSCWGWPSMQTETQDESENQESIHEGICLIKQQLSLFCLLSLVLFQDHLKYDTLKVLWVRNKDFRSFCLPRRSFRNIVLLVRGFYWFTENAVIVENRLVAQTC